MNKLLNHVGIKQMLQKHLHLLAYNVLKVIQPFPVEIFKCIYITTYLLKRKESLQIKLRGIWFEVFVGVVPG